MDTKNNWRMTRDRQILHLILLFFGLPLLTIACSEPAEPTTSLDACSTLCIAEEIQPFYEQYGGEQIFGEPISSMSEVNEDQIKFQVFENVKLDYFVLSDTVKVDDLGSWAFETFERPIDEEITLEGAFLDFYNENYGEIVLGPALTPQIDEGPWRVQYFRNGRLRWNPEGPPNEPIQMTELGESYCQTESCPIILEGITDIRPASVDVTAAVGLPILFTGDEQIIYVIVEAENVAVAGMDVELIITYNGETYSQLLSPTNKHGATNGTVELRNFTPEQTAKIQVIVRYPGEAEAIGRAQISFDTWY